MKVTSPAIVVGTLLASSLCLPYKSLASSLTFFGHSSFMVVTPSGTRILIDPFGNSLWSDWFERRFPKVKADLLLMSHRHFDHSAESRVAGRPRIIEAASTYKGQDFEIRAIQGLHARPDVYGSANLIFVIQLGTMRLCHWGDNSSVVSADLKKAIGDVDVLMVPVDDSEHLLSLGEVSRLIATISPKVVIPMHYFSPGLSSACSPLRGIDKWLQRRNRVRRLRGSHIALDARAFPAETETWVFQQPSLTRHQTSSPSVLPCLLRLRGVWLLFGLYLIGAIVIGMLPGSWLPRPPGAPHALAHIFWPIRVLVGLYLLFKGP